MVKQVNKNDEYLLAVGEKNRRFFKIIMVFAGFLSVALGITGIFVPLLPTTPFLLLAAWFFFRSSEKLYHKLINHKYLGPYIKNYRENKSITKRTKIATIALLWTTIMISAVYATSNLYVRILLLVIAIGVTIHVLSFKTTAK
jgi:hypothetical protein